MCSKYKSTIIKVISSVCAVIQVVMAGTICYFSLLGKKRTSCSINLLGNETRSYTITNPFTDFEYTCHNLLFFVIVFTLGSALCALIGSSTKSFPFFVPALIFQIINIVVTSAAIGFSFKGDLNPIKNDLEMFVCSVGCVTLCIIFFFVYLCSYNHLRSIARKREKY